jgi:LacI family transcriptional regulator
MKANKKLARQKLPPKPSFAGHRKVAICILDDNSLNHEIILGILRYLNKRPQWEILMRRGNPSAHLADLRDWNGDGVIGNFFADEALVLQKRGFQVVNTASPWVVPPPVPTVCVDSLGIGKLAAEHLVMRKFRQFAFVGFTQSDHQPRLNFQLREQSFSSEIRSRAMPVEIIWKPLTSGIDSLLESTFWKRVVEKLPHPIGVFACSDCVGFGLLKACRELGVRVPEEVGVVSVDDDEILCQIAIPRMSSIHPRGERVGFLAAEWLDRLMQGDTTVPRMEVVPVGEVRVRTSTETIVTPHTDVTEAIRFINMHANEPIQVEDIMRVVSISRRSLERYFREVTGMGIHDAITGARIDKARHLLTTTELNLEEISRRCGFRNLHRLNDAFKRCLGRTAGSFREEN